MSDRSDDRLDALRYTMFGNVKPGEVSKPYPTRFTPEMLNAMRPGNDPIRKLREQTHEYVRRTVRMFELAGFSNVRVESATWPKYGLNVVGDLPKETLDLFQRELEEDNRQC